MESPEGEKKWVDTFGFYDLLNEGWQIIASSHETCMNEDEPMKNGYMIDLNEVRKMIEYNLI